jgi:hypothetical protein
MKIDFKDNNLIVFLNKKNIDDIDFYNKCELQKYFRELFLDFKNIYDLDLCGSYDINVYIDKYYGVILEIISIDDDYFDYCDVVDMNIVFSKYKNFLYKMDTLVDNVDCDIYCYNGCFYYEPKNIDFFKLGFLIENGEIIFGSDVFLVKKNGNKVIKSHIIDKIS